MTRKFHIHAVLPLLLALATSCADKGESEPVGIRLQFLDGEGGGVPPGVTSLTIAVAPYASTSASCSPADPAPISATIQVADMTDLDHNGRREAVLSDVPFGCALFATSEGQRRFIEMTLTPEDSVSLLDTTLDEPSFGLTATPLAETDGRVLIAGGFTTATRLDCEDPYEVSDLCFVLSATARAYVFDQGSARVIATQNTMTAARALHSATPLPDGRVMLAGGVTSALLVLRPGTAPSWAGHEIVAISPYGGTLALDSYEIFDPEAGAETDDLDRDGDVGRGRFEASTPGGMRIGRFAHATSSLLTPGLPSTDERRVMLAGGYGTGADNSIEVFTLDEPSTQTGFLTATTGSMDLDPVVREAPGAVMVGDYIYVFGGTARPGDLSTADLDMAVAERWNVSTDGNEWHVAPVTYDVFATEDHPEWVRMFSTAVALGTAGDAILVSGWYGARCADASGSPSPIYDYTSDTYVCPAPDSDSSFTQTLDFIMTTLSGTPTIAAADPTSVPHALGSVIRLEHGARQGQVLVAGGIVDADFTTTDVLDLYTGSTTPWAQVDTAFPSDFHRLNFARALGVAAEVNGGNILFAGGAEFSLASEEIVILESVEFFNWEG
ncbi:MAG: hypothetical protein JRG91_20135 [Deltaproteobacteria bacterium]|nr:hypothetical protein [Deltaproteobacteria bacterium]